MAVVRAGMPATLGFVQRHYALFKERLALPELEHHITLREGAPLLQMLEAPEGFIEGSAEPWVVDVLCALLKASDQRTVLETGGFVGSTAARLAETLQAMGGGKLIVAEIDYDRASKIQDRLDALKLPQVTTDVIADDVMKVIAGLPDESLGFVWCDDDHAKDHVFQEITALLPKLVPKALLCGHDVWGSTDLQEVFARFPRSISLDLPALGPAGGIGLIQV